jgi:PAS domain S-box-containing protein
MPSAPDHPREAERLALLRRCGVLDTPEEDAFDGLAALAAHLADTPIALVSLVDQSRQWFKARHGLEVRETLRTLAFCAHAILDEAPLTVEDAHVDSRFADNALVRNDPHVRFYHGVPLRVGRDRLPLGTLCVLDRRARRLDQRGAEALRLLARQAELLIEQRVHLRQVEDRLLAMAAEEQRVRTLVVSMEEGLVVQRPDGRIVSSNPAAERILGLTATDLQEVSLLDPRWQSVRADGSPLASGEHPAARALATGMPVRGAVMGIAAPGGERRWLLVNAQATAVDDEGEPQGVTVSFSDITALR